MADYHPIRSIALSVTRTTIRLGWLAIIFACLAIAQTATAYSANLVRNPDFTRCFAGTGPADNWFAMPAPPEVINTRDIHAGIDGGSGHRIVIPNHAPVSEYMCISAIRNLAPGDRGVISGYVRVDGVHDGRGAYVELIYFGVSGNRIASTGGARSLTGTTEWERLSQAFVVPPRTTRVYVNIAVHGRGTACFDRVQVEKGDKLTPWSPAGNLASGKASGKPTIAIYKDDIPPSGTASNPAHLRKMAESAGYRTAFIDSDDLADSTRLANSRYDALIMPYGGSFPANAVDGIKSFLDGGGSLLNVGGYPFDRPMVRTSHGWLDAADVEPEQSTLRPLIDPATAPAGWVVGGRDIPEHEASAKTDAGRAYVEIGTKSIGYGEWLTIKSPSVPGLPADSLTLAFRARSLQPDVPISVEIVERDGARWWSPIALSTKWHIYQVDLGSLKYWASNPSVGRGGPDDKPNLADVVAVRFGFTTEFCTVEKPYEAQIAEVWTSDVPLRVPNYLRMNSATGDMNPATFLIPDADAISICDAGAPLSDAIRIKASSGTHDLSSDMKVEGGIRGWSATGQTGFGGPGNPLKARWSPVADALDRYGRKRGAAFAMMWNVRGSYPGSAWAYSGVSNIDLFRPGSKFGESLFKTTLARLTRGVFFFDVSAVPACVRPGEQIRVRARVGSMSKSPAKGSIALTARSGGKMIISVKQLIQIPAHGSAPVVFRFTLPASVKGLVEFHLSTDIPDYTNDKFDCGVAVWSPERQAQGAKIGYRDNYLSGGRGPEFMLGSQVYWGGPTDPLRWSERLGRMADNGISIARSFMNVYAAGTPEGWRQRDAMVQLAAESGMLLFYEGIFEGIPWPVLDDATVEKEVQIGHIVAERYRSASNLFFDIQNEPSMPVTVEGPDAHIVMSGKMRDWASRVRSAIVSTDPKRLVSVGYLNGFGYNNVAWDPISGSRDLDFANRHYYGSLSAYPLEFKQIDMRLLGKAPSTGEFGATSHPGLKGHLIYESEVEAATRFAYIPHTCFGLGGMFCSNWHWQDPIEDIFPCGIILSDGTPRDRLQPYRNSGALFRSIHPRYQNPALWFVIPANLLGPDRWAIEAAMNRGLQALIGLHVEFGVVEEADLSRLPVECKALIWPEPGTLGAGKGYATLQIPAAMQSPEELRSFISDFLNTTGVSCHALTPDISELQSFRVPGENGSVAHVLWNTSDKPVHATINDLPKPISIDLAPNSGGFAAFDGRGQLIAAEGRSIMIGAKVLLSGDVTTGIVSLDGVDLLQSKGVLLLPFGVGKVKLAGLDPKSIISVGEISNAKWMEYERVTPRDGSITLDVSMARSWLVVGAPGRIPDLTARVISTTVPPNALR